MHQFKSQKLALQDNRRQRNAEIETLNRAKFNALRNQHHSTLERVQEVERQRNRSVHTEMKEQSMQAKSIVAKNKNALLKQNQDAFKFIKGSD